MSGHIKPDHEIAEWYNARIEDDPFNPPTCRQVAAFMGCTSSETGLRTLERLVGAGLIRGRRVKTVNVGTVAQHEPTPYAAHTRRPTAPTCQS